MSRQFAQNNKTFVKEYQKCVKRKIDTNNIFFKIVTQKTKMTLNKKIDPEGFFDLFDPNTQIIYQDPNKTYIQYNKT